MTFMKRFMLTFMAVVSLIPAFTSCKKDNKPSGQEEEKLPEPKTGYFIVSGKEYAIDHVKLDVLSLEDRGIAFTISNKGELDVLEVSISTLEEGKVIDLSQPDPNAEKAGEWKYSIAFNSLSLANGYNVNNPQLCKEGSYLKVRKVNARDYEIEFSLISEGGDPASLKYQGPFTPDIYDPYNPMVYYDGTIHKLNSFKYDSTADSGAPYRLIAKAESGLELTIAFDDANNDKQVDLSKADPVAGQSGKQPYVITVKPAGGTATTILNGSATTMASYAQSGSYLWVNKFYSAGILKASARANVLTDKHQLAFDFFSQKLTK